MGVNLGGKYAALSRVNLGGKYAAVSWGVQKK